MAISVNMLRQLQLFVFLAIVFTGQTHARELQLWTLGVIESPVNSCWRLETHYSARYDLDHHQPFLYYIEIDLVRNLPMDWEFVPGYRHQYFQTTHADWQSHPVPFLSLIKKQSLEAFTLYHRSRLEFRTLERKWHFRQKITCLFPDIACCCHIRPVAYEEIFFLEGTGFEQNRFFIGFSKEFSEKSELAVGYLARDIFYDKHWHGFDVIYIIGEWNF